MEVVKAAWKKKSNTLLCVYMCNIFKNERIAEDSIKCSQLQLCCIDLNSVLMPQVDLVQAECLYHIRIPVFIILDVLM